MSAAVAEDSGMSQSAVRVLSEDGDLQELLSRLQRHGRKPNNGCPWLTASTLLVATLSGRRHMEAVVDSWPDFTALVLRDRKDVPMDRLLIPEVSFYTPESTLEPLERLLKTENVITWESLFGIHSLANEHLELLKELVRQKGGSLTTTYAVSNNAYEYDDTDVDGLLLQPPTGFHLGELREEHASLVLAGLTNTNVMTDDMLESCLAIIKSDLRNLPSAAVYTAEGQPVSWITTTSIYLSLSRGYTLPEYRGNGFYGLVLKQLARKHIKLFPKLLSPHMFVVLGNVAARAAALRSHFREIPDILWYGMYQPPKKDN